MVAFTFSIYLKPVLYVCLQKEQELLKLAEVLKMLIRRLDAVDKDRFCIVDFMPNLKWMLSNPTFIKECINEFRFFEEKVTAMSGILLFCQYVLSSGENPAYREQTVFS